MIKEKKNRLKNLWLITRDTFKDFLNDRVLKLSAALAYYTIFSLPSMLIVVVGLCSVFLGHDAVQGKLFSEMSGFIGAGPAMQVQDILQKTTLKHDNVIATIIGAVTLLLAATGIFGEIQDSINSIWGLQAKPEKGFIKLLLNRLISFSMVIVLGFILMVSLVLNALLSGLIHRLEYYFSEDVVKFMFIFDYGLILLVTTVLFGSILKVLPDAKIMWKDVWVGAFTTAVLFMVGKFAIGYYLQHNASISAYGAAGSIILILLWVYYSAIILYFGAEFTQVYVRFNKRRIQPNRYAVWIEKTVTEKKDNTQINKHPETSDAPTLSKQ